MKKAIDISRIKKALSGAQGARLARAGMAEVPERFRNKDSRRAAEKLLASVLDPSLAKQFAGILSKDNTTLAASLRKSKGAAVKDSRGVLKVLNAAAAEHEKALEAAAEFPTGESPPLQLLNIPFLISATDNVDLQNSAVVPSNSWAKFRVRMTRDSPSSDEFRESVNFYYVWRNPKDKLAVINVNTYVVFNGYLSAQANGGFFETNSAHMQVSGQLKLFQWWKQPPTPFFQHSGYALAASVDVEAAGFHASADAEALHVFRGYDLLHSLFLVPPFGTTVIAVSVGVSGRIYEAASAEADFATSGFRVGSPAALVTVLT